MIALYIVDSPARYLVLGLPWRARLRALQLAEQMAVHVGPVDVRRVQDLSECWELTAAIAAMPDGSWTPLDWDEVEALVRRPLTPEC